MATEPASPNRWQQAGIVGRTSLTPRIKAFTLSPQHWVRPRAGQHLDVRLTAPDGYQAQRSYSLTSPPEAQELYEIIVELLPDGEVSPYFHDVAAEGDRIEIRGPFGGHFVWDSQEPGPVLLVGGGSGLAPLIAMARHRAQTPGARPPMLMLAAARSFGDVPFGQELAGLAARPDAPISFHAALSRETPAQPGASAGRLDAERLRSLIDAWGHAPERVYVCGSNRFVETVAQALVAQGIAAAKVRTERFGGA